MKPPAQVKNKTTTVRRLTVSAGQRGTQILLVPADYFRASAATLADLTKALTKDAPNA